MRGGMAPQAACREACEHIARLRGDAIRGLQVGFLALGQAGAVGAFALVPGFTYAEIGSASCRERVCQYVLTSVVAVSLKLKHHVSTHLDTHTSTNVHSYQHCILHFEH